MAENMTDYQSLLADMEAKKAVLEQAIASLRAAMAAGALGQAGDVQIMPQTATMSMGGAMELPVGALLNKSVPAAIKLYLSTIRKKQTTPQIAAALRAGGVETLAADFETVVAGALHRLKLAGEVLRFPDGWGYAEHYPDHIRKAISQDNKPNKKTKKTGKAKSKSKAKTKNESTAKAQVVPITGGLEQRIQGVLARTESPLSSAEIAQLLKANPTGVLLTLGRMGAKGKVKKVGKGYEAVEETKKAV